MSGQAAGLAAARRVTFRLPPKGVLESSGPSDPLRSYYQPVAGPLYRGRIELVLSLLSPPYDTILELGYGSGVLMPTLASIGRAVYGLDLDADPQAVGDRLARLGVRPTLLRGDAAAAPFPEARFDLIVAVSIFEHIADLRPVVGSVRRLLKPGGHLLVGMPRVDQMMERLFPLLGYRNINDVHVTTYRQFLKVAEGQLELVRIASLPRWLPAWGGLYYGMLLRRAC
jgi:SAM-dependent methyltransferase